MWTGVMFTQLAVEKPARPADGDFPPDGWSAGYLIPVRGQDDGKKLWGCAIIPMADEDTEYLTWTTVQELARPDPIG